MIREIQKDLNDELVTEVLNYGIDIGEIGLDLLFDDEILRNIPILKTISSVCKVGLNIKDRYFAKKLLCFINEYHSRQKDREKFNKFISKMEDKKFNEKVTEKLIVIIDKMDEIENVKMISALFESFIDEKITWSEFCQYSKCVNYINITDLKILKYLKNDINNGYCIEETEFSKLEYSANKLINYNFVFSKIINTFVYGDTPAKVIHYITEDGLKFYSSLEKVIILGL